MAYYAYSGGDLIISTFLLCIVTITFVLFISNLIGFLNKKLNKKILFLTFGLMIFMTVFNIITFIYWIKPELHYISGVTSNIDSLELLTSAAVPAIIIVTIYLSYKGIILIAKRNIK